MDSETFVNIHLQPRAYYDNPPATNDNGDVNSHGENYPILAYRSTEAPYTTESANGEDESHLQSTGDQKDRGESFDVPYRVPRYPLSHLFSLTVCLLEVLGLICIALVVCWLVEYHQGFGWDLKMREFNWHPLFMMIGLVFFYANAALSSYVLRAKKSSKLHYFHGISIIMTLFFTVVGFTVGLQVERRFYSFHSWLGMFTMLVFFIQSVVGFVGLFPKCQNSTRKKYLKFQIWIFLCVFVCSIFTCILGVSNYLQINSSFTVTDFAWERMLTNFVCLLLIIFGVLVSSVLMHPIYTQL